MFFLFCFLIIPPHPLKGSFIFPFSWFPCSYWLYFTKVLTLRNKYFKTLPYFYIWHDRKGIFKKLLGGWEQGRERHGSRVCGGNSFTTTTTTTTIFSFMELLTLLNLKPGLTSWPIFIQSAVSVSHLSLVYEGGCWILLGSDQNQTTKIYLVRFWKVGAPPTPHQ